MPDSKSRPLLAPILVVRRMVLMAVALVLPDEDCATHAVTSTEIVVTPEAKPLLDKAGALPDAGVFDLGGAMPVFVADMPKCVLAPGLASRSKPFARTGVDLTWTDSSLRW